MTLSVSLARTLRAMGAGLALAACGSGAARAIVGPSSDGQALAPSVVMVLNRAGTTAGFCSGIVVAPTVILTAAHCVPKGADLRIHYPDPATAPVMLPITGVARNPDYHADAIVSRERSVDLALIRLPAPLPDRFKPATLATAIPWAPIGKRFAVWGYGVGREGDAASSGTLRRADLALRAPRSALLLWADDPAKGGAGACTGDSGGPVTAAESTDVDALMVWSAGDGAHQCGTLTQSLWLAPERAWIERVLAAWNAGSPFR